MTRWIVDIVRYFPIIANVYILAITGLAVLGFHINASIYSYTFIGQNFITNILLYYISIKFRFCKLHRLLIWNMSLCLLFETIKNFGVDFSYSKITITTTSIVLLILIIDLIWKKAQKKVL